MAIFRDGKLFVDNSTISAWKTCKTQAAMRYGYNLKPVDKVNAPAFVGTCLHKALEDFFINHDMRRAERVLHDNYLDWSLRNIHSSDTIMHYDNIRHVLLSWIERNPPESWPFVVASSDHVEMPFAIPLPDAPHIVYCGALDLIVQRRDRADIWYVYDTKSTGNPDWKFREQFDLGSQFTGYIWAAQQIVSPNIGGAYANIVHRMRVPQSKRKCNQHNTEYINCGYLHPKHELKPVTRNRYQITEWLEDVTRLAKDWYNWYVEFIGDSTEATVWDIKFVTQDGKWGYQVCPLCDYKDFCNAGRPVNDPGITFIYEEWKPGPFAYEGENEAIDIDELLSNPLYSGASAW